MTDPSAHFLLLVTMLSTAAACIGVWIGAVAEISRKLVPAAGAILILVCLIWVLPDLAASFGWTAAAALLLGTFSAVWIVDRFVYPICPSCAHTHDHDVCATRLHGFAAPLLLAATLHSLFDGYALVLGMGEGLAYAVIAHKLPEALALGSLLRAAMRGKGRAFIAAISFQLALLPGAAMAIHTRGLLIPQLMAVMLALAGGTFLYLGFHAVHGEWKRRVTAQAS